MKYLVLVIYFSYQGFMELGPIFRLDNIGLMVVQAISHYIQSYFSICITIFDRFPKIHF